MDAASCWSWRPAGPCRLEQPAWLLRLDGPDALRFLHGQSSQAIEQARPGAALATCLISPTARMRGLARVLVDELGAWLLIEAGDPWAVRAALDRVLFPVDQVRLGAVQPALLITPLADDAPPTDDSPLPDSCLRGDRVLGGRVLGEPGRWQPLDESAQGVGSTAWLVEHQLLLLDPSTTDPVAHPLLAHCRRLSAPEQERWRIQQGWPAAPGELNDGTNPFELGLTARVSLSKGCYVGQETLARLATYDGVKQQLRRWCWWAPDAASTSCADADATLTVGQSLWSPSGDKAATITSVLQLRQGDGSLWIGLALVRRSALALEQLLVGAAAATGEAGVAGAVDERPLLCMSVPEAFVPPLAPLPVGSSIISE